VINRLINKVKSTKKIRTRLKWLFFTCALIIYFYKFSLLSLYSSYPTYVTMIGTLTCSLVTIQTICVFDNILDLKNSIYTWKAYVILFIVSTSMLLYIGFIIVSNKRLSKELKAHGKIAYARFYENSTNRKPIFKFYASDGRQYECKNVRSKNRYFSYRDKQISYSKRNPAIYKQINSYYDHLNYTSLESRYLVIDDFVNIADLDSIQTHIYLNKLFIDWTFNKKTQRWENGAL